MCIRDRGGKAPSGRHLLADRHIFPHKGYLARHWSQAPRRHNPSTTPRRRAYQALPYHTCRDLLISPNVSGDGSQCRSFSRQARHRRHPPFGSGSRCSTCRDGSLCFLAVLQYRSAARYGVPPTTGLHPPRPNSRHPNKL